MTTLFSLGATTVAGYRLRTGDDDSAASSVSGSLVDAERMTEEGLRRKLSLQSRTAPFLLKQDFWYGGLRVYPDAWPITASALTISGRALLGATPDLSTFIGLLDVPIPARATVTWTGGFDATTLPISLRDAIYDLARARLSRVPALAGALSASVGDTSVTYASPSADDLDSLVPGLTARIAKYRNRYV